MLKKRLSNFRKFNAFSFRVVEQKTKGSLLGITWFFLLPLIITSVYVLIITLIFNLRFDSSDTLFSYAIYVLTGQVCWLFLSNSIQNSSSTIKENSNLIKYLNVSLFMFPYSAILESLFNILSVFILLITLLIIESSFNFYMIIFPVYFIPIIVIVFSLSIISMIIGLVIPDFKNILNIIFYILIYLTPVLLKQEFVPSLLWKIIELNPLTKLINYSRNFFISTPEFLPFLTFTLIALVFLLISYVALNLARNIILDRI